MDATVALLLLVVAPLVSIFSAIIFAKTILTGRVERVVGFFHPFTNDGGGGERVLWCAVRATQQLTDLRVLIYTGDAATPESLTARAREKFGIVLLSDPLVVPLRRRKWVEAATYPRFTLIGQSLGSILLAWEALTKVTPLLFIDTSGYAFTYPLARLGGCKVACYTHYPTISSDMLQRVQSRTHLYNNDDRITKSLVLSHVKLVYYKIVAYIYGWCGSFATLVMVNGSWTRDHIMKLWNVPKRIVRIYPPCDTVSLQAFPLERSRKEPFIISVAQFRPEKAHDVQLEAFKLARHKLARDAISSGVDGQAMPRLKLVGSCRNSEDEERVEKLRQLCLKIGIEDVVDFCLNVPYRDLLDLLSKAVAGLHTMLDEHFGISVVEYMAAGAIPIAHRSGGPKLDIVVKVGDQQMGYLAETEEEFADAIIRVFSLSEADRLAMASAARQHASNFSEERFDQDFKAAMRRYFKTIIP